MFKNTLNEAWKENNLKNIAWNLNIGSKIVKNMYSMLSNCLVKNSRKNYHNFQNNLSQFAVINIEFSLNLHT